MMDYRAWLAVLAGAAGGGVAIGLMEAFAMRSAVPVMAIPFATSIVLVLGSPEVDAAQPRALIGGHLVATVVGLLVLKLAGPHPWAAAIAVAPPWRRCTPRGRSIRLLASTRCSLLLTTCPGVFCWFRWQLVH
jgi:HPP family